MPTWLLLSIARVPHTVRNARSFQSRRRSSMGELAKWRAQNWVRISSSGKIAGKCGTSKNKKNPDRCLPMSKARSLSTSQRAATARKKKAAGAKGKQFVSNTPAARVSLKIKKRK